MLFGGFACGYGWGGIALHTADGGQPPTIIAAAVIVGMVSVLAGIAFWWGHGLGVPLAGATIFIPASVGLWLVARPFPEAALQRWTAIALLVLGVLLLIAHLARERVRRRRAAELTDARRRGHKTTATVTDRGYDVLEDRLLTAVTFTFNDLEGRQRWVGRPVLIRARNPVAVGQTTRLWFDPRDPGNQRRIVVELAEDNLFDL